jgi:hypothetical protein
MGFSADLVHEAINAGNSRLVLVADIGKNLGVLERVVREWLAGLLVCINQETVAVPVRDFDG